VLLLMKSIEFDDDIALLLSVASLDMGLHVTPESDRAASTVEKPRQIVMQCTNALLAEAAILMPKYTAIQRTIEHQCKWAEVPLPMPRSLADITIPDKLAVTSHNDNLIIVGCHTVAGQLITSHNDMLINTALYKVNSPFTANS